MTTVLPGPPERCLVAPSPALRRRLLDELAQARERAGSPLAPRLGLAGRPRRLGFEDGVIFPPRTFPLGVPARAIRSAAADRAPLRGTVRVVVVLVDFPDRAMTTTTQHVSDLFSSARVVPTGSVREYFTEVTGGLVEVAAEVVGPLRMPQELAWYAGGNHGIGEPSGTARAQDLARDAAVAVDAVVDLAPFDNDGNGYVDAFIVVHAGRGGEETGDPGDLWSHKWVLPAEHVSDTTSVFAYLTVPEDAKLGVVAHELGHLVFGFPDLYDTDGSSEGVGDWCLMGGGSWNGGGDTPAHPSAWCKAQQGWAAVHVVTADGPLAVEDVRTSRTVHRLWRDGGGGPEYFLLENRQRAGFDAALPGDGLLLWRVDEHQEENTDEGRYRVGLLQADGERDLERAENRGDDGDAFPGSSGASRVSRRTTPSTLSATGQDTCVAVTGIPPSAPVMTVTATVRCAPGVAQVLGPPQPPSPVHGLVAQLADDVARLQRTVGPA